jgi:signal peptidase II
LTEKGVQVSVPDAPVTAAEDATEEPVMPAAPLPGREAFLKARWVLGFALVVCFLIDQLTKLWAVSNLVPGEQIRLLGGAVSLRLVFNAGAAFSMGENVTVVFAVVACVAILGIAVFIAPRVHTTTEGLSVGVLLAGIAGNLTDRIIQDPAPMRGHVVDFISLPHFAVLNVADIWITLGAIVIAIQILFPRTRR